MSVLLYRIKTWSADIEMEEFDRVTERFAFRGKHREALRCSYSALYASLETAAAERRSQLELDVISAKSRLQSTEALLKKFNEKYGEAK